MTPIILVADDDDSYGVLLPYSAKKANLAVTLHFVRDGDEAIHYLIGEGIYSNRETYPVPHLLLLDLKMPRVDGFDVLVWKRTHPEFRSLPVAVWSSSDLLKDKEKAMSLGAVDYFCKPSFQELSDIIRALGKYWAGQS